MARYVLVHGAWHGGWCWRHITAALGQAGHEVRAVDLPGHGGRPLRVGWTTRFEHYVDTVVDAIGTDAEPVILVGHSLGGYTISAVAEKVPERIRSAVYLAAMVPANGERMYDSAGMMAQSAVVPAVRRSALRGLLLLDRSSRNSVVAMLYADSPAEDVDFALARLCPEPLGIFGHRFRLTAARFGRVPKAYFFCERDRAVLPEVQAIVADRAQPVRTARFDTDHSPFFSDRERLVEALLAEAEC